MSFDAAEHISVFAAINATLFQPEYSTILLPKYPAFHTAQRTAFFSADDASKLPTIFSSISTTDHDAECSSYFSAFRSA